MSRGVVTPASQAAAVLKKHDEAEQYFQLHRVVCAAFRNRFFRENGSHITTGFLGTTWNSRAFSENGHRKGAFKLPFQVKMGAATVWEH